MGVLDFIEERPHAAVVILGALLFLPFLGSVGLFDPWETHYAEVAREMIARRDYVYPYWSNAYFFSKPVLTPWLVALGLTLTGAEPADPTMPLGAWVEWGVRLPFALLAIAGLVGVYRLGAALADRRTGLLAAFILGTSPMFVFIGKQAITDLPAVALMVLGLAYFVPVLYPPTDPAPYSRGARIGVGLVVVFTVGLQLAILAPTITGPGWFFLVAAASCALGLALYVDRSPQASTAPLVLAGVCFGLSVLAKGLAIAAVVGPAFVLAMVYGRSLQPLLRARLHLLLAVAFFVAAPWYLTMIGFEGRDEEGQTFLTRFFVHDHLNRIGSGVHGDRGGIGYFGEQLLYGFFPWSALLPWALFAVARRAQRAWIFILLLGVWSFALFTLAQTKLHHYIFPALPPLALVLAVALLRHGRFLRPGLVLLAVALFGLVLRDLLTEPRTLVSLFTYKYDRTFPRELVVRPFLVAVGVGGLLVLYAYLRGRQRWAFGGYAAIAASLAIYSAHYHFNMLSPHWSQAHLIETYFRQRRGPHEPLLAFQLNWRGETFYSRNQVVQVMNGGASDRLRSLIAGPGRSFIVLESQRLPELRAALPPAARDHLEIVDRSNAHFYLCVLERP